MMAQPVVNALIALCGLMFVAELGGADQLIGWLGLWPLALSRTVALGASEFHPWQVISYAFLHGGVMHLVLNLYALWLFGVPLERRWGSLPFAAFYLSCVVGAALLHLLVAEITLYQGGAAYPVIGASGGVFGLLLAFGYLYPEQELLLLIPPMPVKARWFVIGYGAVELLAGVTGSVSGVAHFAHLGGMLTGYLILRRSTWLR